MNASITNDEEAATTTIKKRRTQNHGDVEHFLSRVQMGELSAGRRALEGAELAPRNVETLRQLRLRLSTPRACHITLRITSPSDRLNWMKKSSQQTSDHHGEEQRADRRE